MFKELLGDNLDKFLPGWLLLNEDDQIVHWSAPAQEILGYSPEEILNKHFSELLPDYRVDRSQFLKRLQDEGINDSVIHHQLKMRHQNQIILEVDLSLYPISQEEKNFKLLTLEKITEIAELQQYTNNKQLQLLDRFHFFHGLGNQDAQLRDIYDAVLVALTSGQGLRFNRAFLFLIDQDENRLKGIQAIGPGSKEEAKQIYSKLFEDEPNTLAEMINLYTKQKMESDFWINEMIQNISIDLSELDHILIQSLYHQRYRIINRESSFYDLPSTDWLRQTLRNDESILVPLVWHGRSLGLLLLDNAITGEAISENDVRQLIRFANVACTVIINIKLLIQLEQGINAVNEANLNLKESQASLFQKEKLAAKGELLNLMAHEVRGPLAVIGGFAQRVFNKLEPESQHKDSLSRIVETSKTLELVLNDILDKQLNQAAEIIPDSDAAQVINRVTALLEEEIKERKISINFNIQGDLPRIQIVEHHLFEILNNLIKNALEALGHDGLLLLVAKRENHSVTISIQDTGPGISRNVENRLFSPYFTTKDHGTGLGLVVVRKLVAQYDGKLEFHSIEGRGTTFIISFPIVFQPNHENQNEES